jgi:hypothetical protein
VPTHWGEHFLNSYASRLTVHSLEANFQARPGHSASTLILMNFYALTGLPGMYAFVEVL